MHGGQQHGRASSGYPAVVDPGKAARCGKADSLMDYLKVSQVCFTMGIRVLQRIKALRLISMEAEADPWI